MNLLVRLLLVLAGALRRPRLHPLDEAVVRFRVLPNDLDYNLHMNNGRYLSVMDLGRLDWVVRAGIVPMLLRRRWNPVVGSLTVRYRRPLEPFDRYELRTRIVGWDEKWFYVEQRFERRGEVVARAFVKGLFLAPGGARVPPGEVVAASGREVEPPPMPEGIREWTHAESIL